MALQTGDALGTSCGAEQRELIEEAVCGRGLRFGLEVPQEQESVLGRQQAEPGLRGGLRAACWRGEAAAAVFWSVCPHEQTRIVALLTGSAGQNSWCFQKVPCIILRRSGPSRCGSCDR